MAARSRLEEASAVGVDGAAVEQPAVVAAAAEEVAVEEEETKKRRLFRFRPRYDLALLTEVITHFPWGAGYGNTRDAWDAVALAVQKRLKESGTEFADEAPLDHTIVKRRADVLLDAFRRGEMESLRGTGTPKELATRHKMLAILSTVVDVYYVHKGKGERSGGGPTREESMKETIREAQQSLRAIDMFALDESDVAPSSPPVDLKPRRESSYSSSKRKAALDVVAAPPKRGRGRPPRLSTVARSRPPNKPAAESARPAPPVTIKTETKKELELRERELRVKERRLELEEQRLAWQMKEADQQTQERLALLEVLRAQSALNQELLTQLRAKPAIAKQVS